MNDLLPSNNPEVDDLTMKLYIELQKRYNDMAHGTRSEIKVNKMMSNIVSNCCLWPADKTGRWVGYVQCLLIEVENVTSVKSERNFTRPYFHKLYDLIGRDIPPSIDIYEND